MTAKRLLRVLCLCATLLAAGCAQLPARPTMVSTRAESPRADSPTDAAIAAALAAHPGQSAFHLVAGGREAFALRGLSARRASHTIDVQYYIWHNDLTGRLLARELVAAADRGVRVRLLLDDLDARSNNFALAALAAHPRISVRLFNPFVSRSGLLGKGLEMLTSFKRINHRMHNKSWIVDNDFAVAGGRNIGDEYFSASDDVNFRDLDLAMIGPVVQQLSGSFDRYWNSSEVWPIVSLSPEGVNDKALEKLRTTLDDYARQAASDPWVTALRESNQLDRLENGDLDMQWASQWQLLSDDPAKQKKGESPMVRSAVLRGLSKQMLAAQSRIELISPYFVPGDAGTGTLVNAAEHGREVEVLTNSLAANDVVAVHSGYAKYRRALLAGGVGIWELKPDPSGRSTSLLGSSGASLHSKAAVFDASTVFVGSFNLDPRSVSLNCEQGFLVTNAVLAEQLHRLFLRMTAPRSAWQVALDDKRKLRWSDGDDVFHTEPKTSLGLRMEVKLIGWLPVEPQL